MELNKHSMAYINWSKDVNLEHKTNDEIATIIKDLYNHNRKLIKYTTNRYAYKDSFSIKNSGRYLTIYYRDIETNHLHKVTSHIKDDDKNTNYQEGHSGKDAFEAVRDMFSTRTGQSITQAFGTTEEEFKVCIPKQFYYTNEHWLNQTLIMSGCDYCSQYPSNLCGLLPDSHDSVTAKGTIRPTEEYPFAFYLKSGHVAQFNVFDTHDWLYSMFYSELFGVKEHFNGNPDLNPDDDVTVLMKASKFSFDEEMKYFYSQRHENSFAKLVMNAFIGFLHKGNYTSNKQAHIAAIVIARANNKMMYLAEKIGKENVVHIAVDGIIYKGKEIYGSNIKALNELNQEFVGAIGRVEGSNCYVMEKDGKVIKFKHGAYNARRDGKDINICNSIKDMKQWYRQDTKLESILKEYGIKLSELKGE